MSLNHGKTAPKSIRHCSVNDVAESLRKHIHPERLVESAGPEIPLEDAAELSTPRLSIGERIAGETIARELKQEERAQWAERQLRVDIIIKSNTELRLRLEPSALDFFDLEISREYYSKYKLARFENDHADRVADLLTSFREQYPLEWQGCGWKSDAIAELMLESKEAGQRWLKVYWNENKRYGGRMRPI
jgi:hypothetical protein